MRIFNHPKTDNLLIALLAFGIFLSAQNASLAQRIFEQPPFDLLTLKVTKRQVRLLPMEERSIKINPKSTQTIKVRPFSNPNQQYEVAHEDIESIQFFEQMVLDEANDLVESKNFDGAYDYFQYLEKNAADFPGVKSGVEGFLFAEAKHWQSEGVKHQTLALLNELYVRNKEFENLSEELGKVNDIVIKEQVDKQNYTAARRYLRNLSAKFPENAIAVKWTKFLKDKAAAALKQAQTFEAEGKLHDAYQSAVSSVTWSPGLEGVQDFLLSLHSKYPVVSVGVRNKSLKTIPIHSRNFSRMRTAVLDSAFLLKPTQIDSTGRFTFSSSFGEISSDGTDGKVQFTLGTLSTPEGSTPVSAYDVLQGVYSRVAASNSAERFLLEELQPNFKISDEKSFELVLSHPYPQIAGFFYHPLNRHHLQTKSTASPASYAISSSAGSVTSYLIQEGADRTETQPAEIFEKTGTFREQLKALQDGQIAIIDRIAPWELKEVKSKSSITLIPYASATVCMLLPNKHSTLAQKQSIRQAISLAINRQEISTELAGPEASSLAPISGPFPKGYAYNNLVKVPAYHPETALGLSITTLNSISAAKSSLPRIDSTRRRLPKLVIAYQPSIIADRLIGLVKTQLEMAGTGFEVELKAINKENQEVEYDLMFVEWTQSIPATDVYTWFSSTGKCPLSTSVASALVSLSKEKDAAGQNAKLQEVHRAIAEDVAIIPLWQVQEHLAVKKNNLKGLPESPVSLYQNIEKWSCPPWIPSE